MLEENPQSAWTAYNLALALEAMQTIGRGRGSTSHRAIDIDPKLAKIRAELGQLELTDGDHGIRPEVAASPRLTSSLNWSTPAEIWR